tara:strand:- start:292 stop:624 length:333 start_codon:yes stop_codon:yes gene_type:complete
MKIWEESIKLVGTSYNLTKSFPDSEKFNLVSQMNRSAVSIPSNIAEGSSKSTNKHFKKFLETSLGSAFEWETQLIVARNENYLLEKEFIDLENRILQIQKMNLSFMDKLE